MFVKPISFVTRSQARAGVAVLGLIAIVLLVALLVIQPALASTGVYNVKDFGARGDGVTNDAAAIQSAINQAGDTPVYLPSGTYVVKSSLLLKSGLTLYGDGTGSTIRLVGGNDWTRVLVGDSVTDLTLRDFKVDGNAGSGTVTGTGEQRHCIFLYACTNSVVERVTVTQPLGDGIFLYAGCSGITVRDCTAIGGATNNPRVGINVQGANNCLITGNNVTGFDWAYKAELDSGDSASTGNRIVGNTSSGGKGLGLLGTTTGHVVGYVVEGNTFSSNGEFNIWVSATDNCVIRGNIFTGGENGVYACYANTSLLVEGNSYSGHTYTDVYLGEIYSLGASSGIRVTGNAFASGSRDQGIVFHVGTTVTGVEIDNNTYATGATFYNGVLGATAYLHDNGAASASTTTTTAAPATTTTVAPTTTTTSTPTTTVATPSTTTTTAPLEPSTPAATVTIKSPAAESTVKGRVTVSVTVSSSTKVGQVLLHVDGVRTSQDTRAPYSFSWNTASVAAGSSHTLTAIAYDRGGVELGRASCRVTIASSVTLTPKASVWSWWW